MELFFNLLWLTLSFALVTGWLRNRKNRVAGEFAPTVQMQFIALLVLIVVLLPVVSLTDDLQACTAPAESEHAGRRVDMLPDAHSTLHQAVMIVAMLESFEQAARLHTMALAAPSMQAEKPSAGYLPIAASRPPPAV